MRITHISFISVLFFVLSFGFTSCDDEKNPDVSSQISKFTIALTSNDEAKGTATGGGTYNKGTKIVLKATPAKAAYMFVKWSDGNTDNPREVTALENVELVAIFDYACVDLGLPSGLKWATCNVGADSIHHYGDYFAWGEVEPKTIYSWENYFDTTDKGSSFVEYKISGGKTILEAKDDAATMNMGVFWRMPTKKEMEELVENCTWKWTDNYSGTNIKGKIATGPNGNSIFFPAAGFYRDDKFCNKGISSVYWSKSLYYITNYLANPKAAFVLFFESNIERSHDYYNRYEGRNVRGVCE